MARRTARHRPVLVPTIDAPQPIRRAAKSGPTAVAGRDWPDPDDTAPAKTARRVQGWARYDSIAVMARDPRSGFEAVHVHAANKLRELADAVMYGYSGDWLQVFATMVAKPRLGPTAGEIARVRAAHRLSKLWPRFTEYQQRLLIYVVLENRRIADWCRERAEITGRPVNFTGEKTLLRGLLDQIWQYFETEITREIDIGRRSQV